MRYASLSARLIAILIDNVLLWILGGFIGRFIGGEIFGIGLGFIIGITYNWYFLTRNNGQTPGKTLLGVRVVKANGGPVGDVEAVVRYVGYYINTILLLLGWLWAIPDDRNQGFHDKLAGTVVVRA